MLCKGGEIELIAQRDSPLPVQLLRCSVQYNSNVLLLVVSVLDGHQDWTSMAWYVNRLK